MGLIPCECGCGEQLEEFDSQGRIRKFVIGHNWKGKKRPELSLRNKLLCGENSPNYGKKKYKTNFILCECGCGTLIEDRDKQNRKRRFVKGHSLRGKSNPMYGISFLDEHKRKISENHADVSGENHWNWKGGKPHCPVCDKELSDYNAQYCLEHVQRIPWNKGLTSDEDKRIHSKENHYLWNGGRRIADARQHSKRKRELDFIPLNDPFENSEGHHINKQDVIYIPKEWNHIVDHNVHTGKNMDIINSLAFFFLVQQNINKFMEI